MTIKGRQVTQPCFFKLTSLTAASTMLVASLWLQLQYGTLTIGFNLPSLTFATLFLLCVFNWLYLRHAWIRLAQGGPKSSEDTETRE